LRVTVVNRPGVLTGVAQVFAMLHVNIETLVARRDRNDPARAEILVTFQVDAHGCDLICGKLTRLIDVLSLERGLDPSGMDLSVAF